jgi:hypothetical protein
MQIMQAYGDLGMRNALEVGCNPVIRRPLLVSGHDTEVMMDFLEEEGDGGGDGNLRQSLAMRNQEVRLLSSQILHMRRELMDARAEADRQIGILKRQMARMSNNISRLSNRPGRPLGYRSMMSSVVEHGGGHQDNVTVPIVTFPPVAEEGPAVTDEVMEDVHVPVVMEAKLTKCPKTLHDLWKEFEFGFSGLKPAKDWTAAERGRDKYKYYRRNVVWQKVSELVRGGFTAESACDRIYSVYGASSTVSDIIKALIRDKKNGGHRALRIGTA